ncbi:MAG: helix-turn-helix transcriptional regulator [Gammaproteobacteria bacterium]
MNERMDLLVRDIHRGVLEEPPWQSFIRALRLELRGGYADMIFHHDERAPGRGFEVCDIEFAPPDHQQRYFTHFHRFDPFPYATMQAGRAYLLHELIDTRDAAAGVFYHQFMKRARMDYEIMFHIADPGGCRAWVAVTRPGERGDFDAADRALCERLVPHLGDALAVFARLRGLQFERDAYANAFDSMGVGVIGLDAGGRVTRADEAARRLCARRAALRIAGGELQAADPRDEAALRALIRAGLDCAPGGFARAIRIGALDAIGVLARAVTRAPVYADRAEPRLVLYLSDASGFAADAGRLRELFGLSAREAALAAELARGSTLTQAAAAVGITEQTARTYSKRIFAKTGTRGQTDLVRLILASAALVA